MSEIDQPEIECELLGDDDPDAGRYLSLDEQEQAFSDQVDAAIARRQTETISDGDKQLPPRNGRGKFMQTQESAERDAQAARMRKQGWSLQAISDKLGYGSEANVHRALKRLKEQVTLPAATELVEHELAILDGAIDRVLGVLAEHHVVVSHGRVMHHENEDGSKGDPLEDHDMVLKSVTTLQRLTESRRKLLGLDAATKTEISGDAVTVDPGIASLIAQAKERALGAKAEVQGH